MERPLIEDYDMMDKIETTSENDGEKSDSIQDDDIHQVLTTWDIFSLIMLMWNQITAKWVAYLPAYANPGNEPFTSLEIDLNLSKTEYGILTGVTFALISGIFAIVSGIIVDRFSRKYTLIIAGTLWGGLTIAQSFSINFVTILIPRIVMEISVTACDAAAFSLISDYFCQKYRARASSIFMLGLYIGVAGSSLAIIAVNHIGWRNTYRLIGAASIVVTLFTFFIFEPVRGKYNTAAKRKQFKKLSRSGSKWKRLLDGAKIVLSSGLFIVLWAAAALRFFGGYAIGFWGAKFFQKQFPEHQTEYSIVNALTILFLGVWASYTGGYLSDKFSQTQPQVKAFLGGFGALIAYPFLVVAFAISQNFWISMISYLLSYFPGEMWLGPAYAMIQNMFPAEIVGTATAIFNFTGGIAGAISNILLGALGDAFDTDKNARIAGYLLTIWFGISYIGWAPLFITAGLMYRKFIFKEQREVEEKLKKSEIQEMSDGKESTKNT